eukprot:TRINITY_DN42241_c0_g1_i1.p1 TRINITY_DN42241_c0_g1~~TRINITY_DN42241_c0_g1_i1.p1  ORF type:complete len:542 (+),score=94.00 TRINITY_DN42241_c0_g1_i1:102-1628(+)
MAADKICPDLRAINTFLRGCLNMGDVPMGCEIFEKMSSEWGIIPDSNAQKYVVQLLSQGLRVKSIKDHLKSFQSNSVSNARGNAQSDRPKGVQICKFWKSGNCGKGTNCTFFHDPDVAQANSEQLAQERSAALASMHLALAHAAAMLGRWAPCRKALRLAEEYFETNTNGVSNNLFQRFGREELRRELNRISSFAQNACMPELTDYLCKTFLFDCAQGNGQEETHAGTADDLATLFVAALCKSFGLDEVLLRSGGTRDEVVVRFRRCVSQRLKLRANRIFHIAGNGTGKRKRDTDQPSAVPVKLEICSGNGDWVVAQAEAEKGKSNWIALELKHDRVHNIFSRMVFEQVDNLCLIRGDAARVIPNYLQAESISHVFINFPEPPHLSGNDEAESKHEFLTVNFFEDLCVILAAQGRLTVLSDNHKYIRKLASLVAKVRDVDSGKALYSTVMSPLHSASQAQSEDVQGVEIHHGLPGKHAGHAKNASSFFDRFWSNGQHTDRFFFVVQRI